MIFIDANIFMYFVGTDHPRREEARAFFSRSRERDTLLVTSAEVLQELLHVYVSRDERGRLCAAFDLVDATVSEVWPVDRGDVEMARDIVAAHPELEARDLVHLACCIRREPDDLMTFDRALAAAWRSRSPRRRRRADR
ncbi:type II toxin-antitoxin system VapC family toxin [Candidatus Palauibacter sp.]|uniref:type II toxin-antitoxin system VapC family toxin n=1 Tax=Candidatus Palauibacter sp. TaxID=3101350 RepID=UPI003B524217